ncbi:MAG: acetoacetate--CoA ligase, partial [Pseudomonas sp.]|nr:acetoacetate--CoA ligase [Pseudomonas sp.]
MNDVLWRPSTTRIEASRMEAFRRRVNRRFNLQLDSYAALHRWSIEQRPQFWQALAEYFHVRWHTPPASILEEGEHMTEARWFQRRQASHLLGPAQGNHHQRVLQRAQ